MKVSLKTVVTSAAVLLISLVFACSVIFAGTTIADGTCGDGVTWVFDSDGVLAISGTGAIEDYATPSAAPWASKDIYEVVIGEGITRVGKNAFCGLFLDMVTLPESLTSIGDNAFDGCAIGEAHFSGNLKQWRETVSIGSNNTTLEDIIQMDKDVVFDSDCIHLANGVAKVSSPYIDVNYLKEYGDYTFEVCFENISYIKDRACCGNMLDAALKYVHTIMIPEDVTSIEEYAFYGCSSLVNIMIPDSVTSIGYSAFCGCSSLTGITVPDGMASIEGQLFCNCSSLVSITIPDSVVSIGERAFQGCSSLMSVTIPDSVTSIGESAFNGCGSLTSISLGNSVNSIGRYAFWQCHSLTSVSLGNSKTSIGESAFRFCSSLVSITIPDSVTSIGDNAFDGCSSLTSIMLGDSATSIGDNAFYGCSSLVSITRSDSVTSIGSAAFYGCSSLANFSLGNSVTSIGTRTFCGCGSLSSIALPDSVTRIGNEAFQNCISLVSITIPDSVTSIGDEAFQNCFSLVSITIPDGVKSIGRRTFCNCRSLASITVPDSVTRISEYAFSGCSSLVSITIPDSVTSIMNSTFYNCYSLESIVLNNRITSIGDSAFENCNDLSEVFFDGYESEWKAIRIGNNNYCLNKRHYAIAYGDSGDLRWFVRDNGQLVIKRSGNMPDYAECETPWMDYGEQINTILFTDDPKNIGNYAFAGLSEVTTVTLSNSVNKIGEGAFKGCTNLSGISLPSSLTTMGKDTFRGCEKLDSAGPSGSGSHIEFGWNRVIPANAFQGADALRSITIPSGITRIQSNAFLDSGVSEVHWYCTFDWSDITIQSGNDVLLNAVAYKDYHEFGDPVWTWENDNSTANAVFTCTRDALHVATISAEVVSADAGSGAMTYTATAVFEGNTYTDKRTVKKRTMQASAKQEGDPDRNIDISIIEGEKTVSIELVGDVSETTPVLVASYDENGRFLGMTVVTEESQKAIAEEDAADIKIFWVNDESNPIADGELIPLTD